MEDRIALFEIGIDFSAKKLYEIRLKNITLPQHNINIIKLSDNTILVPTLSLIHILFFTMNFAGRFFYVDCVAERALAYPRLGFEFFLGETIFNYDGLL